MAQFVARFVERMSNDITNGSQAQLMHLLRKFRGDDLEAILGELDTIIGLDYASSVGGTIKQGTVGAGQGFSLDRTTASKLLISIKHAIIKEYRDVDGQRATALYKPLFNLLFPYVKKDGCLPVFTTNYDPAIEEFCRERYEEYGLCDGFAYDFADRQNYWHRSVFDKFEPDLAKRNITLFKLHGSVDWLSVKSSQRIRRGQAMFDVLDSDAYGNVLIYPATRKIATDDPFYTGYEYFERCCERAKVCIAIGYSFRDYDALTRLRGAASLNDDLQLVIVDPNADKVLPEVWVSGKRRVPLSVKFGEAPEQLDLLSAQLRRILGANP